ncbi:unnamed protein product [Musa textilis]
MGATPARAIAATSKAPVGASRLRGQCLPITASPAGEPPVGIGKPPTSMAVNTLERGELGFFWAKDNFAP